MLVFSSGTDLPLPSLCIPNFQTCIKREEAHHVKIIIIKTNQINNTLTSCFSTRYLIVYRYSKQLHFLHFWLKCTRPLVQCVMTRGRLIIGMAEYCGPISTFLEESVSVANYTDIGLHGPRPPFGGLRSLEGLRRCTAGPVCRGTQRHYASVHWA